MCSPQLWPLKPDYHWDVAALGSSCSTDTDKSDITATKWPRFLLEVKCHLKFFLIQSPGADNDSRAGHFSSPCERRHSRQDEMGRGEGFGPRSQLQSFLQDKPTPCAKYDRKLHQALVISSPSPRPGTDNCLAKGWCSCFSCDFGPEWGNSHRELCPGCQGLAEIASRGNCMLLNLYLV